MIIFSENNLGRGRPNINIVDMYEEIIVQRGIHQPMTKRSFDVLYTRYKKLGGKIDFSDLGESLTNDIA